MEKHTDRILWSIFILAIGVSLFIFGKPAYSDFTQRVFGKVGTITAGTHYDPKTGNISNIDDGFKGHGTIKYVDSKYDTDNMELTSGTYPNQYYNAVGFLLKDQVVVPWDHALIIKCEVKPDRDNVVFQPDINNGCAAGKVYAGNDNDALDMRTLIVDNSSGVSSAVGSSDYDTGEQNFVPLKANEWNTVYAIFYNLSDTSNPSHYKLQNAGTDLAFALQPTPQHKTTYHVSVKQVRYAVAASKDAKWMSRAL